MNCAEIPVNVVAGGVCENGTGIETWYDVTCIDGPKPTKSCVSACKKKHKHVYGIECNDTGGFVNYPLEPTCFCIYLC